MKKLALVFCVIALSGCSVSVPTIKDVNCTAQYKEKTFPYATYSLNLVKYKNDNKLHQNKEWYKLGALSPVKFASGWAPASALDDIKCQISE